MAEEPLDASWFEYRRMVIGALERIDGQIVQLSAKIDLHDDQRSKDIADLRVAVGMLQAKTVIYGVIASIAATAILNFLLRAH